MFALGILAGWCNENTSGGALLIVLGYLGWQFYTKRKLSLWMFTGVAGNTIGLALMALAPGNKIRATYFARSTWSLPRKLMTGIITIFEQMKEHLSLFLLILILLLVLYAYISQDKKSIPKCCIFYFWNGYYASFSHLSSSIRLRTFILWSRIILDYRFFYVTAKL